MKLTKPKNQNAEVLYELLNNKSINRRDMLLSTGILNVPARISDLRNKKNVSIICRKIETKNKHGRTIKYGEWLIPKFDIQNAKKIYFDINK